MSEYQDPFQTYDKTPAVSFKGKGKGYKTRLVVMELPRLVQKRDFKTKQPAVWTNKDGSTSPKMTVAIKVEEDGQTRTLWADKPSSLFAAIRSAQAITGQIQVGSALEVEIVDIVPADGNDKKEYGVVHTPPDAFEEKAPY